MRDTAKAALLLLAFVGLPIGVAVLVIWGIVHFIVKFW